jgi:hypothetical protein
MQYGQGQFMNCPYFLTILMPFYYMFVLIDNKGNNLVLTR